MAVQTVQPSKTTAASQSDAPRALLIGASRGLGLGLAKLFAARGWDLVATERGASAGLEACVYDHGTASFLVNNDGSTANPHGETDVIPATFVLAGTPANPVTLTLPVPTAGSGFKIFPLGNCDPTGIDHP